MDSQPYIGPSNVGSPRLDWTPDASSALQHASSVLTAASLEPSGAEFLKLRLQ
jgi:hypothetical protein